MKEKIMQSGHSPLRRLSERKIQERNAVLYRRDLERWNHRVPVLK